MKLYNIELRGSRVLYTIHIHWHLVGSQVAHCAPVGKAIDGLSISLWTEGVCLPHMAGSCCCAHSSVDSHKVKRWPRCMLTHLFCSRLDQEGRQTGREGGGTFTTEPPNVMEGAAHYCHGNPASVIFGFDQQRGSDEIPHTCFLLSR